MILRVSKPEALRTRIVRIVSRKKWTTIPAVMSHFKGMNAKRASSVLLNLIDDNTITYSHNGRLTMSAIASEAA
jgi:hypothetical protein